MAESALSPTELRLDAVNKLQKVIGFETWCWPVADPASLVPTDALAHLEPSFMQALPRYLALGESGADLNLRVLSAASNSSTAMFSELTSGDFACSPGWDECMRPAGMGDFIATACCDGTDCWGWFQPRRTSDERSFTAEDSAFLGDVAPPLGVIARSAAAAARRNHTAPQPPPPGVVILDGELRQTGLTPAARVWLDTLLPYPEAVLGAIAGRALRAHHQERHTAHARLRTTTGVWAMLDGASLEGFDEPRVAITLRAAAADEVLDILCRAHGLTARETQLARHLVNGLSTRQIADQLWITPYTVKDHLKAMFRKVDVTTRGELVSQLTGRPGAATCDL